MEKIQKAKTLKVQELVDEYNVSIETIRDDLAFLEKQGYLRRVYGGAVLPTYYSSTEMERNQRERVNDREKRSIGKLTASLINDGDSIFVDYGTTTIKAVRHLAEKKNLTLITNAVLVAQELSEIGRYAAGWKIILLGGELKKDELTVYGDMAVSNLRSFNVAKTLLGVGGIDLKAGVTDYYFEEAGIHRSAVEKASTVIAMATHDKFGLVTLNHICPVKSLDILVTDWKLEEEVLEKYRALGITVYRAPEEE